MTALRTYRDAVASLLTTDPVFVAAVAALVGQPVTNVYRSNRPIDQIPAGMYPCWVIEAGDGRAASITNDTVQYQTIGLSMQTGLMELHVVLVWMDQDRERAADTRLELPYLLTQLMLQNPQPGGCDQCEFQEWQPDTGINHPTQVWRAKLVSAHTVPRSG